MTGKNDSAPKRAGSPKGWIEVTDSSDGSIIAMPASVIATVVYQRNGSCSIDTNAISEMLVDESYADVIAMIRRALA